MSLATLNSKNTPKKSILTPLPSKEKTAWKAGDRIRRDYTQGPIVLLRKNINRTTRSVQHGLEDHNLQPRCGTRSGTYRLFFDSAELGFEAVIAT